MAINQSIIEALKNITYQDFILKFTNAFNFPPYLINPILKEIKHNLNNEIIVKSKFWAIDIKDNINYKGPLYRIANCEEINALKIKYVIVYGKDKLLIREIKTKKDIEVSYSDLHLYSDFFDWGFRQVKRNTTDKITINPLDHLNKISNFYNKLKNLNEVIYKEDINGFNLFISRILFCLYIENNGTIENKLFTNVIKEYTNENGEDTICLIDRIFDIMGTGPYPEQENNITKLQEFPLVSVSFFYEKTPPLIFNKQLRKLLIELGLIDWSVILNKNYGEVLENIIFNGAKKPISETDVLKIINPLFLDELNDVYLKSDSISLLKDLLSRIKNIKIFDPNCNYGAFLLLSYKKLKELEEKIIKKILTIDETFCNDGSVHVSQLYGIEENNFVFNIAKLSLYIANIEANACNDVYYECDLINRDPLNVIWENFCTNEKEEVYLLGKPPFRGYTTRNDIEKENFDRVFMAIPNATKLDYCACWLMMGTKYISQTKTKLAFMLTLDISQGELMASLWEEIFTLDVKIKFAYLPFESSWDGKDILIISLTTNFKDEKLIISKDKNKWVYTTVENISPYLKSGPDQLFHSAAKPISPDVKKAYIAGERLSEKYNVLEEEDISEIIAAGKESVGDIFKHIENNAFERNQFDYCKFFHPVNNSGYKTKHQNNIIIGVQNNSVGDYLIVDFFDDRTIIKGNVIVIPDADMYHFGILSSRMHKFWAEIVRATSNCRFMYRLRLGYNAFPWPKTTKEDKELIAKYAELIYLTRMDYPTLDLNDLYNLNMPDKLKMAHSQLDEIVDNLYSKKEFRNNKERFLCLVDHYNEVRKK